MLPKFVCRLVPALVLRNVVIKSMNATGVMVASPILNCRGDGAGAWAGAGGGGSAKVVAAAPATAAGWVDSAVEEGSSSVIGSAEVPCCCRASRRGEIKRPDTMVMTNMNVLMANLTILNFR